MTAFPVFTILLLSLYISLGLFFLYSVLQKAPLQYNLPKVEKKTFSINQLEVLIKKHFPTEKAKQPAPQKSKNNAIQIASREFKVLGYSIGKPSAVILQFKRKIYILIEGEKQKGIELIKLTPDYVLIKYNGKLLKIPLEKKEATKGVVKISKTTEGGVKTVPKSLVERLTQNYGELLKQIDFAPYIKHRHNEGFYIRWISPNSIFYKLGFRRGDVILSVNGIPIKNTEDLFRVVQIIRNEPSIRVEILRNGERKILNIRIE